MKNNKLWRKIFFCTSVSLIPLTGLQAEVGLSEGNRGDNYACDCSDTSLYCDDFLNKVKIDFDIDTEDGATFEKYVNINNSSEVGYRSCTDDCSIVFAGKCKVKSDETTPTPTPTTTEPDDSPTPTATVTVPEPDPTQTPEPVCNYYSGSVNYLGFSAVGVAPETVKYTGAAGNLSCLTKKINSIVNVGYEGWGPCGRNGYYDDCVAIRITDEFFGDTRIKRPFVDGDGNTIEQYGDPDTAKSEERNNGSVCTAYDYCIIHNCGWNACTVGEFYLNENCESIRKPEDAKECGKVNVSYYKSCPISLVFEKDFDINSDLAFVNFNLDPAKQDSWYTWKASNKAPLLVYDPDHTGRVDSSYQLFGEWTFGGKQSAGLPLNENFTPSAKWENGFEALASLDRDFDGKLTGEELNELALWFDGNRDAISQEGEVMSLADAGVTTLYVNGYKKDANGDLRLDLGYERKLGDEVIQGASIDWYGKGADSKKALVELYSATFMKPNLVNQNTPTHQVEKKNEAVKVNVKTIDVSELRGIWDYFVDGEDKYETPDGYLILGEGEEPNSISGHSLSETIFTKSSDSKRRYSHVGMFKLTGHAGMSAKNEKIISFSIQGKNMVNESRAMLSADKKTLIGTTSLVLNGGVKVATYNWKAVRQERKLN